MKIIKCQICGKEVEATSPCQKYCPECAKEVHKERKRARSKEHYKENKEKVRAQHKEYYNNNKERYKERYENNKEKVLGQKKEYYENNKEKICAREKKYYEDNKEKVVARKKEYYKNNKEKVLEQKKEYYKNNHIHADREGNNFCVYIHTDPLGKVYIGRAVGDDVKTVNRQRWQGGNGYRTCPRFLDAIQEYGWDNIQHELLEWGLTYEEVIEREQYWIERYNSRNPEYGYNVA